MRKLIFYISAICICISCISSNSQTANSKDNAEIPFVSSPIPAYTASSPLEENLVNQFNIYIDAMRNGNVELVKQYLYSDLFAQYPADYKNRAYQTIVNLFQNTVTETENNGFTINFVISDILKQISDNDRQIYVCETTMNLSGHDKFIADKSQIFAISTNNGESWQFLEMSEDAEHILSLRFSQRIISQIVE